MNGPAHDNCSRDNLTTQSHRDKKTTWASSVGVRRIMQGNKSKDTQPELRVRRLLHAQGFRYKVDFKLPPLPRRRADIAFTRQQLAIFIDGCFWHGCETHYREPRTNPDYWRNKISNNVIRDQDTNKILARSGWSVRRYWAHSSPESITADIIEFLSWHRTVRTSTTDPDDGAPNLGFSPTGRILETSRNLDTERRPEC